MSGYRFARAMRLMLVLGFGLLAGLVALGGFIYRELTTEARFRQTYGPDWQAKYEQFYEPLSTARVRVVLASATIVLIIAGTVWVFRIVRAPQYANPSSGRRRRRRRHRHLSETTAREGQG
jgi:hypothetical protein